MERKTGFQAACPSFKLGKSERVVRAWLRKGILQACRCSNGNELKWKGLQNSQFLVQPIVKSQMNRIQRSWKRLQIKFYQPLSLSMQHRATTDE
jgi:hypothetical protein